MTKRLDIPCWLILAILSMSASAQESADKPNIIVIMVDDMGYADAGFTGATDINTPNLDRLAASGVIFTRGYANHPFCAPSRAALLSGRYQHRFGFETNPAYDPANPTQGIDPGEILFPKRLQAAGYTTGGIGKWHLGAASPFYPNNRGFDYFYGFLGGGHDYFKIDLTAPVREAYLQGLVRNNRPAVFEGYLPCVQATQFSVNSPDEKAMVKLNCSDTELSYTLSWQGKSLVEPSTLSLIEQADYSVLGVETKTIDETWKPVWGSYSEVRDHCRQLILKLEASGLRKDMVCRIYNDGVGFRFSVPAQSDLAGQTLNYDFNCKTSGDFNTYALKGESEPFGPVRLSMLSSDKSARLRGAPVVLDTNSGSWLALLESDLYSARCFGAARFSAQANTTTINVSATAAATAEGLVTPWRVILVGNTPGDLLNSTVTLNLAAPCELTDTSWIKPGKGLWDWRIHGYDNGEFKYGIDTRSYLRIIDFAAEYGIDYFTIDDHWFTVGDDGELITVSEVELEKVMAYAKAKGVKIILYYDRKKAKGKTLIEDEALFSYYQGLGAAGLKYGFMGGNVPFTRAAIEGSAEKQLLIFFHDGPVPMTGVERTLPNLVSREYCHAQQDSRRAFSPSGFLKMAMINVLTGPLDQANGNFGIKSINAGERMKGPKKLNSYVSTVVSEVARCLVISSGLVTLPDAPEEYRKKADLFEFLKQMPATWDETRVINSKMGETITTARRSGKTWFVGSVNNEIPRELNIALDFLEPGVSYKATLFQDTAESHGIENPEVYEIVTQTIKAGDTVVANMAMGGGHAMILRPAQ